MGDERWKVDFYEEDDGTRPVQVYLDTLPGGAKQRFATNVEKLESRGTWVGRPVVDFLEDNLWELRLPGSPGNPRVLFCATVGKRFVLLHGFNKTGPNDKVPESQKRVARSRRDYELERLRKAQDANSPQQKSTQKGKRKK